MNRLVEIQNAIEKLTAGERAAIESRLHKESGETDGHIAEPSAAYKASFEPAWMSVDDYLAFEETSPDRHEYVAGRLFAMSGVTYLHNVIVDNLVSLFNAHLGGGPCRALSSGVKVQVRLKQDHVFYYPDVTVNCDQLTGNERVLQNPVLVVEVLSTSTEAVDRREKALNYRQIDSLQEYVLVAQDRSEITLARRAENWRPTQVTSAASAAEFRSMGLNVPLSQIYEMALPQPLGRAQTPSGILSHENPRGPAAPDR